MNRLSARSFLLALIAVASLASIVLFVPWTFLGSKMAPLPASISGQVDNSPALGLDGMIVYIDEQGQPPVTLTAGWHNKELRQPASGDAYFKIASISKLYLAVVAVKLAAQHHLELDNTLVDYLPDMTADIPGAADITVRMLLQHRSGIPDYIDADGFDWFSPPTSPADLLSLVKSRPLAFTPGTRYSYSNSNYVIVAAIIDRVSGKSYRELIDEKILRPLKLENTFFSSKEVNMARLMSGYIKGLDVDVKPVWFTGASSEMVSTAADTGKFIRALNNGSLLTSQEQRIYGSVYEFGHTGLLPGYSSIARYHQDIDTVVVQFVNNSGDDTWALSEANYDRVVAIIRKRRKEN